MTLIKWINRPPLFDDVNNWFAYGTENELCLSDFDVILMRKDPPFDMEYIYASRSVKPYSYMYS